MELFFASEIIDNVAVLTEDEAQHCVKVLRHRVGDCISVIDGSGALYACRIVSAAPKEVQAQITGTENDWGGHPYSLTMAVCPTKNMDRYEWFAEKSCEMALDRIIPVTGEHSERRTIKPQRLEKILLSATKQSLKGKIPVLDEMLSVSEYIKEASKRDSLKLIAYCFEDASAPRMSIKEALVRYLCDPPHLDNTCESDAGIPLWGRNSQNEIEILIGPEGDFSDNEASLAIRSGFIPIHLGPSRLRTETAALVAVQAVYSHFLL